MKPASARISTNRLGFSLVEISLVLVILGLLVGGVLAGKSLVHAAALRSITTERDKYVVAITAFHDKYSELPGDMKDAYNYWFGAPGCMANSMPDMSNTNGGCNGNGDGMIADGANPNEMFKFWTHLSREGLIDGAYDGTGNTTTPTNSPISRIPNNTWAVGSNGANANIATENMSGLYPVGGIYLTLWGKFAGSSASTLTHGDAFSIDTKTDDGHANTGKMRGSDNGDCSDENTDGNAANGFEDDYAIKAYGESAKGDCIISFIIRE